MKPSEAIALVRQNSGILFKGVLMEEMYSLLSYVTGKQKYQLFLNLTSVSKIEKNRFIELVKIRSKGVPLSQIMGSRSFWKSDFLVDKNVLDPRPDTETIIEVALQLCDRPSKILDLGTGSGCLACSLTLEYPSAKVIATDKSFRAIKLAKTNAEKQKLDIDFIIADWMNGLDEKFDLIVCNPPYVSFEEYKLLDKGLKLNEPQEAFMPIDSPSCTGYEVYHLFYDQLEGFLTRGGIAIFEVGKGMAVNVEKIFSRNKNFKTKLHRDINGVERVVSVINM